MGSTKGNKALSVVSDAEHWRRDHLTEDVLQGLGLAYDYVENIPLDQFDLAAGLRNQARLTAPLDRDLVMEYALAMLDGDVFPAVIVERLPATGLLSAIDANHRLHAATEAKLSNVAAYILRPCDPASRRMALIAFNRRAGKRTSMEEGIQHGIWLVTHCSQTIVSAARVAKVSPDTLGTAIRTAKAKAEFAKAGIPVERITNSKLERVGSIPLRSIREKAAKLVAERQMSTSDVDSMVMAIKRRDGVDEMECVITEWEANPRLARRSVEHAKRGVKPRDIRPISRILTSLEAAMRILDLHREPSQMLFESDAEIDRLNDLSGKLVASIMRLVRNARST